MIRHRERHRRIRHAFQIASPPVIVIVIGVVTLDKDEKVRVNRQNSVAAACCRQVPVIGSAAIPAGAAGVGIVGLVTQIHPDDSRVAEITSGKSLPVSNPVRLGIRTRIPEAVCLCAVPCLRPVVVEDHLQPNRACVRDDVVQHLQRVQPLQIRVRRPKVGPVSNVEIRSRGLHHLVRERYANGVVALILDGLKDGLIVLVPQPMRNEICRLKPIPVDSGDAHRLVVRVKDLGTARMPITGPLCAGYRSSGKAKEDRHGYVSKDEKEGTDHNSRQSHGKLR